MDILIWIILLAAPFAILIVLKMMRSEEEIENVDSYETSPPKCPHIWGLWSDPDENGRQIRSCGLCNRAERISTDYPTLYPS